MDTITLSRRFVERQYPDVVRREYVKTIEQEDHRQSITTQTEERVLPQSFELVKSVESNRGGLRAYPPSSLCTPPYRKRWDERGSSLLSSSPLMPHTRPTSVLHANTFSSNRGGPGRDTPQYSHSIVVAIDFGTAYSGYAYSFTRDPESVHIMRKWEGDDPGMNNQKSPTILLLTPDKKFHSFGTSARDYYHDLEPLEARRWFFFDKFKMLLHHNKEIGRFTMVKAANGCSLMALNIFALTLRYFKDHALRELSDASDKGHVSPKDVRWVITVPAIWRQRAKGFMREAAYEAGIASPENPEAVFIALEPEAASIHCRKLRLNQLIPDINSKDVEASSISSDFVLEDTSAGGRYMVVDCGGGTADITVHEITNNEGKLKELFKASGGPYGSLTVDESFERLLDQIFGRDFMKNFRISRPSGFIDLMIAFESRKRSYSPDRPSPINISLPYSFIEFFKNHKSQETPESLIKNFGDLNISWSSQGMLRIQPSLFKNFFRHSLEKIIEHVNLVLDSPNIASRYFNMHFEKMDPPPKNRAGIAHLFLVGGFAESPVVQEAIRRALSDKLRVIIPQGVGVAVLKGAVLYGLDPSIVFARRSRKTYGIGVIKPFVKGKHPIEKRVTKDGSDWCLDVFDKFVSIGESITLGDAVSRKYRPASPWHRHIEIHIFSSENENDKFVTDPGVEMVGSLCMDLKEGIPKGREIQAKMLFGDTEIKASAMDLETKKTVRVKFDFLNEHNPKYSTKL